MKKILFPLALALFGMMFVLWILSKTNIIHETPSWWTAYIFIAVALMVVLIKSSAESPSTMMSETAKESALTARLTPAELAQERRASFRLVKSEEQNEVNA